MTAFAPLSRHGSWVEFGQDQAWEPGQRGTLTTAAIAALYDRHGAPMFSVARQQLGTDAEAQAVLAAAFGRLMRIGPRLAAGADVDRLLLLLVRSALPGNAASDAPRARPSARPAVAAPIPVNEAARMAAVHRYDILDTPADGAFDRITALAARLFDVPIAIVSIVDHDRIWFKSHPGMDAVEIGRDAGLCASAILQDEPWILENAAIDPRSLANPIVAGEHGLHFYAAAPLHTRDGYNLGTLCILDRAPRAFAEPLPRLLADLAGIVMHELELRLAARCAVRDAAAQFVSGHA